MKRISLLIISLILPFLALHSQTELSQRLPTDPDVRIRTLENGLVYYLKRNAMPENRMEMRLVVNAGSILENEEQQGLAHFCEHMAFNGSRDFSKNALVHFLESAGVRFGADLNAYTSFDETVYMLQVPTDRQGLVDSAYMVLENWAHLVSYDEEEIDKERGVIREEWRQGLGADDRMRKQYFPVIFKDSHYANRLPIGTLGVIDTAAYESLRAFYRDWYRPNLQAVVVVGDIDLDLAEQKIVQHFAHIKNPENERERKTFDVPDNKEPLIAIASDKEATSSSIMLLYKHPKELTKTYEDYRRNLMQDLYSGMIINRLQEINKNPESPFVYAYAYYGGFMGRAVNAYTSVASIKENRFDDAIAALVRENERVRQHGYTAQELERQKLQLISRLERRLKEQDKTNSSSFVQSYINNYLNESPILSIQQELDISRELLDQIKLEEINALAAKWITDENMLLVLTAPDREEISLPTEAGILKIIENTKAETVEAWVDSFVDQPLFTKELETKAIRSQKQLEVVGVMEYLLENGIRVITKPTDFKNDEILLTAFGPGGASIFEDEQALAASNISRVISASGIGNFSSTDLSKKLTGKIVNVQPYIEELRQGFRGSSSPNDFETMLQLISLYFDGARHDEIAFEAYKSQMANQYKFLRANPKIVFADTLSKLATQNSKRTIGIPTDEQINSLQSDEIYTMFDRLFATAKDYTFIFTGNFDPASMLPLVSKYLGNLPTEKPALKYVDHDPHIPDGITDVKVFAGTEYQSQVAMLFQNKFNWSEKDKLHLSMLIRAYNIKLRENMREELGGVYGVGVRATPSQFPKPDLSMAINWSTNPDMVDTLTSVVFNEMRILLKEGPTEEDLAKVKETAIRERESNDKQNNFWNRYLENQYYNNDVILNFESYRKNIEEVTIKDLQAIAKKYLNPDHYLRLVSYPEEMK